MANKKLADILAVAFAAQSGYTTPVVGDPVEMSGDYEVILATDGTTKSPGFIEVVSNYSQDRNLTVRTPFTSVQTVTASGTVAAGDRLVNAGSQEYRAYVSESDDPLAVVGMALTGGTDEEFEAGLY